jgi:hypothetical protein
MGAEHDSALAPAISGNKETASSTADVASQLNSPVYTANSAEEQRLLRKLDLRLIPIIMLVYLVSFLDRGEYSLLVQCMTHCLTCSTVNIGNAKLYGLEADLGLQGSQYQICVSILFVTYCVC